MTKTKTDDEEGRIHKTEIIMNWKLNSTVSLARERGTVAGERGRGRSAWRSLIVPVLTVCLCGPVTVAWASPAIPQAALASGASPRTEPSRPSTTQTVGTGTAQDSAYAAREGQSKDLETFKGGEPVVIVTSTAVLIVAIILLIVLI